MAAGVAIVAAAAWSCFFQSAMKAFDTASGEAPGAGGMATVVVVGAVVVVGGGIVVVVGDGFGLELHPASRATRRGAATAGPKQQRARFETLTGKTMTGILANAGLRPRSTLAVALFAALSLALVIFNLTVN